MLLWILAFMLGQQIKTTDRHRVNTRGKKTYRIKAGLTVPRVSCYKSLSTCLSHPFWLKEKKKKASHLFLLRAFFSQTHHIHEQVSRAFQLQKTSTVAEKFLQWQINVKSLVCIKKFHISNFFVHSYHRDMYLPFLMLTLRGFKITRGNAFIFLPLNSII